jgi:NADH-quinone oxidoreductase subunit M
MPNNLVSLLIFLPLLGTLLIILLPTRFKEWFKWITVFFTGLQLIICGIIYWKFKVELPQNQPISSHNNLQFIEKIEWINLDLGNLGQLSIDYFVAIDGLNLAMVLLSGLVMFVGAISSFEIHYKTKGYFSLYLLLSSTIMGCFVALDFFLFYLFFEFMLLPMYFLIGIWGGEKREYASIKFFIYTLVGSLFILIVMIALYLAVIDPQKTAVKSGLITKNSKITEKHILQIQDSLATGQLSPQSRVHTFNLLWMMDSANYLPDSSLQKNKPIGTWPIRVLAFLALFVGFAIKLPIVPLHTWLPDAHVEAPTPVSVILAGVLLKIGGYGIIRIAYPIFPDIAFQYANFIAFLGVLAILYGALNALAMADLKKMIAYSSVSHLGFALLGIASLTNEGINGAIFQMFSHGILSAMLFILVGVLYARTHNRLIDNYRGLLQLMPIYTAFVMLAFFASLGLPGFSGFIGELFTLIGGFKSKHISIWLAIFGVFGIVLGAAYFLWTLQKIFFGKLWLREGNAWADKLSDLTLREILMLTLLSIITLTLGIFPHFLFELSYQSVTNFLILFNF